MTHIHPALIECEVPVFYATTDGQTRRIAERLVVMFGGKGLTSGAIDVASSDADYIDWRHVRAAVVGASLRRGRHQRAAEAFVREYAADLNRHPFAFFSVSLATASPHAAEREAAARLASALPEGAGWRPEQSVCLAGRLAYTQYGILTRLLMTWIARRQGGPTDTSRDHELTNWDEVARLADTVAGTITAGTRHAA